MWTTELLSQVATIVPGNSVPAKKKEALYAGVEGMPYVATKDISYDGTVDYDNGICIPEAYLSEFRVSPIGATLICAEGGSAGRKIAYSYDECCYVNKLVSLQPNQKIAPKFLYYYALSADFQSQFKAALHGLIGGVSLSKMKSFYISYPPLAEQQRIVAKLDAAFAEIDTAIEVAEAKEAEVEKLKASLLSASLSADTVMWETVMWETVKLGDVLKTGAGGTPLKSNKEYYESGAIKWLLSGAVCERDIEDSKTYITEKGLANSSAKLFPENTVLVAMYGATAGQVGILRTEASTNQAVCGIYPSEDYLAEFLYYYLTSYKETLLLEVSGVAQPNLSQMKIKNIPLPLISLAEQQRIVAKLDAAFAEIDSAKQAIQRTKENHAALKAAILAQELAPPTESEAA